MIKIFLFFGLSCKIIFAGSEQQRRIGKSDVNSWEEHYSLGANKSGYEPSIHYSDLSVVGALVRDNIIFGTATLVAPNFIVTAAHVPKDKLNDDPNSELHLWEFVPHHNIDLAPPNLRYNIEEFIFHPAWIDRQVAVPNLGDGHKLGIDLAIARLNLNITGVSPARLPSSNDDPLGKRAILAGFGDLVEGHTGNVDSSNVRRLGGENVIDRSVEKVAKENISDDQRGGLLAIDFDTNFSQANSLGQHFPISNYHEGLEDALELLGGGTSEMTALPLESSTAHGDSGGPAFVFTKDSWRVHGVVSFGTNESKYGDVTLYTRLASHYDWLLRELPDWADSKLLDEFGWRQNPWLGILLPVSNGWVFHISLGWIYTPSPKGNDFWGWSHHLKNWIWLSDLAVPFVYCFDEEQPFWVYLDLEKSNGSSVRAYNYFTKSWKNYP